VYLFTCVTVASERSDYVSMPAECRPYANARELLRTSADSYGHYFPFLSGIRLTYGVLNLTRSWSRGKRFESARRLSQIGLSKANTWGSEKPSIHRWEHLTPLRYKLRAVPISSTVFLSIEVMQCSADLHTGTDDAANRAAAGGVKGNPYT
jgi:hypothetical protein